MQTLFIKPNELKAALLHAAKKDIRYYLNGVYIKVNAKGIVYIAATTGHTLFLGKQSQNHACQPMDLIIPRETIEAVLKINGKSPTIALNVDDAKNWRFGDLSFKPIDGKFPNINHVIPDESSGEIGQYQTQYLNDARESLRIWTDNKKADFMLNHNGDGPAFMAAGGAFVLVMPLRANKCETGETFKLED